LRITKPNELLDKKDLILINIFVLALLLLSRIYIFNMVEQTEQINTTKRFIKIKSSHQKRKKKKKKKKKKSSTQVTIVGPYRGGHDGHHTSSDQSINSSFYKEREMKGKEEKVSNANLFTRLHIYIYICNLICKTFSKVGNLLIIKPCVGGTEST